MCVDELRKMLWSTLQQAITIVFAVALLCEGAYLAWSGSQSASALGVLGFGFLFVILLFLAKFKRFKAFGVECEMWEEKQEEAAQLIDSLRRIHLTYGKAIIEMAADPDYRGDIYTKAASLEAIRQQVVDGARLAGLSPEQLREIRDIDQPAVVSRYIDGIRMWVFKDLNPTDPNPLQHAMHPIISAPPTSPPAPETIKQMFDAFAVPDGMARDLLEDYTHYLTTGQQRRPEVWARRMYWSKGVVP